MSRNKTEKLKEKYYEGTITPDELVELFESTDDEVLCAEKAFYDWTKEQKQPEVFDYYPETHTKTRSSKTVLLIKRITTIAAVMVFGFLAGMWYSGQKNDTISVLEETLLLTIAEQRSVHVRLKALEITQGLTVVKAPLKNTLIEVLNSDENVNVRLAAFNTLINLSEVSIQPTLIESITNQESELLQEAIIKYILSTKDNELIRRLFDHIKSTPIGDELKFRVEKSII